MGAAAIPLIVSALGAGAGAYNADRTARRQDDAAAAGIQTQQLRQREADQRIDQEIGAVERSSPEAERQAATDQFLQQLRTSRGAIAGDTGGALGGASDRFAQDSAAATAGVQNFGERAANVLGRIRAPVDQRQREAVGFGRASSDIGQIARTASGDDFLNRLRLSGIRRNPWIDAAGETAQAYARGAASRARPPGLDAGWGSGANANNALADAGFG